MVKKTHVESAPAEHIASAILVLRGHRVILDRDLAAIYGVTTGRLNEAVKRNTKRFPEDFMFRLTPEEAESLRSQNAILKSGRGSHAKYLPHAFTEHGAIQAANILSSARAIEMSVYVVRAFVKLREVLASNTDLARRLDELEARIEKKLTTHDQAIGAMLSAIRQLLNPAVPKRRPIGFTADIENPALFSYFSPESRVPAEHPLRAIKTDTDAALKEISAELGSLYSSTGWPSIPPERLLKANC